ALAFLAASLLLSLSWRWPEIHDALMPQSIATLIYPISKTDLDLLRVAHFLVLAWVATTLLRPGAWLHSAPASALRCMGRHSLEVFCVSVLLAPLADAAGSLAGDHPLIQVTAGLLGVLLMWVLAAWLDVVRRPQRSPAPYHRADGEYAGAVAAPIRKGG
ncbi:MAG: OpgC domain-containing protein, partial [Pseudomonadota bacterium]